MHRLSLHLPGALAAVLLLRPFASAEDAPPPTSVVISVADQKLALLRDGGLIKKFPVSTSKFGLGDSWGSYKTPTGRLRVCDKIGDDLTVGAVFKHRHATGEVLPVNAPGRDPIVTRILWLDGLEAQNANARQRGIYIHGTTEESRLGEAVSYGCIRMRSKDVLELFGEVPLDAAVTIIAEKLPRFAKYAPPKPPVIAAGPPAWPEAPAAVSASLSRRTATPEAQTSKSLSLAAATKLEPPLNSLASHAFRGSMLDAGLPEGPSIPTLPAPSAPEEVPRLSTLTPGLSPESGFSLQGIARDLSPVIRAADTDAAARAAVTRAESEPAPKPAKPVPRIAFRAGPSEEKPKE